MVFYCILTMGFHDKSLTFLYKTKMNISAKGN